MHSIDPGQSSEPCTLVLLQQTKWSRYVGGKLDYTLQIPNYTDRFSSNEDLAEALEEFRTL